MALAYALEGADVAIAYNHNEGDAAETRQMVEARGRRCLALMADVTVAADRWRLVEFTSSAPVTQDVALGVRAAPTYLEHRQNTEAEQQRFSATVWPV